MAVKTITIDLSAYEALSRRKRAGQSFSDVIKAHFATGGVGADLLAAARRVHVGDETLDGVARVVAGRTRSRARTPAW
jgi:predicted CopG family antitoxin